MLIREPGILTVTFDGQQSETFEVLAGPWRYAQLWCWQEKGKDRPTYAGLDAVLYWNKEPLAETA